jgi:iron complex outermembrane recepter protein
MDEMSSNDTRRAITFREASCTAKFACTVFRTHRILQLRRTATAVAGAILVNWGFSAAAVSAEEPGQIEEITVTAQKRAQASQDVPVTMDAYSGQQLIERGATTASDLAQFTPGLQLGGSSAGQTLLFGIRGVVQQDFSGDAESPVATYVDEGYIAANSISSVGLFDIDHVEVLKGPQGTLFGRNATGGVVSIFSKQTSDTFGGYAEATYGSYGTVRFESAVGGPLTDTLKARIAGVFERNNDYVTNVNPSGDDLGNDRRYAVRGRLDYTPVNGLDFLLTAYTSRADFSWGPYFDLSTRAVNNAQGVQVNSVVVNQPNLLGAEPSNAHGLTIDAADALNHGGYSRTDSATLKTNWDFGPVLTLLTNVNSSAYSVLVDNNAGPLKWLDSDNGVFTRSVSQEARIYVDSGPTRWTSGIFYLNIRSGMDPNRDWFYFASSVIDDRYKLNTNSYSAFSEIEYDVLPKTTIVAGARVTREFKNFDYSSEVSTLDYVPIGPSRTPYEGSLSNTLITAKLQAQYHLSDVVMLYGGWNRGAKAGSFNAPFAGGTAYPDSAIPYRPEVLNAFEFGEKGTFADGRTRLNAAAFYYDYQDYQAFNFIGLSTQVTNLPAKTYGGEIDLIEKPWERLTLQASASYVHNRVYDVSLGGPGEVTRVAPYTSPWKAAVLARYEFPLAGGTFSVQGDASYTDTYYFSLTNYDASRVADYTLLGARFGWTDSSGLWNVGLKGENLADRRYGTVGFDITGLCGCTEIGYGKPRWIEASVRRQF